jgi:hypothetical protein
MAKRRWEKLVAELSMAELCALQDEVRHRLRELELKPPRPVPS